MMNEKKQRRTVLIGVLLLIGLFALGYIGINRIAFAGSGTTAVLGLQDNHLDEHDMELSGEVSCDIVTSGFSDNAVVVCDEDTIILTDMEIGVIIVNGFSDNVMIVRDEDTITITDDEDEHVVIEGFSDNAEIFVDRYTVSVRSTTEILHNIHDGEPSGNPLITETADENNGRERGYFNVDRLVSLQDHYLTREEAEVIVAEVLYERVGIEFDTSEFVFGLLDQSPGGSESMWLTGTRVYDANGQIHDIAIDAVSGNVIEFQSFYVSTEFFTTVEHRGISFVVEEWGNPVEGPEYSRYIRPYMITQVEAAKMAADFIYEEFGMTMEGLRMQMPLGINDYTSEGLWSVWIMPAEDEVSEYGLITPASLFLIQINATTGEIIDMDFRGFDTVVEENNEGRLMRIVILDQYKD